MHFREDAVTKAEAASRLQHTQLLDKSEALRQLLADTEAAHASLQAAVVQIESRHASISLRCIIHTVSCHHIVTKRLTGLSWGPPELMLINAGPGPKEIIIYMVVT